MIHASSPVHTTAPLRIVAVLPGRLQPRLHAAAELLSGTIVWSLTPATLWSCLRTTPVDIVVISLVGAPERRGTLVEALLRRHPSLAVLVYTTATPASIRVLARLSRHGLAEVVFARYEDTPGRFARTLQRVATSHGRVLT